MNRRQRRQAARAQPKDPGPTTAEVERIIREAISTEFAGGSMAILDELIVSGEVELVMDEEPGG